MATSELPNQGKLFDSLGTPLRDLIFLQPATILGHLLGHEGPGSIHAYLKNKGWISYLSAGIHGGGRGFSFFKVIAVLTKDGMGKPSLL